MLVCLEFILVCLEFQLTGTGREFPAAALQRMHVRVRRLMQGRFVRISISTPFVGLAKACSQALLKCIILLIAVNACSQPRPKQLVLLICVLLISATSFLPTVGVASIDAGIRGSA